MAKTQQGSFETTYHHIDAPTVQDDDYGREFKKRKLVIPPLFASPETLEKEFRNPTVAFLANQHWACRRKLDGENIRIYWDGEQALWNGKTNAFQCSGEFTNYMNNTFIEEIFEEKFGHEKKVVIFGEKMGPKTQGNELGLEKDEVIIYDVCIDGYWLDKWSVKSIAEYFGCRTCYDFMTPLEDNNMSLIGWIITVAKGQYKDWEGLVLTPAVEIRDQKNHRIIVKVKNKDYLR